ncbi:MAG TPA: hypothetical protein VF746_24565 [Longimicrobium sp.]|jgi:modification target Cys-rich repeat protein
MRKLKLSLEALEVESFDTSSLPAEPGTVRGHGDPDAWNGEIGEEEAITTPPSEYRSCNGTCYDTCPISCYGSCVHTCESNCTRNWTICPTGVPNCCAYA